MLAAVFLLVTFGLGAVGVVGLALLLRLLPRLARLRSGTLLLVSHTLIVCGFLALAPAYIVAERARPAHPYGDVYLPFALVPGCHICWPLNALFGCEVFPWLLDHMESFPASVICTIVGPGLVGMLVGGLQWYILGAAWDRLQTKRPMTDERCD